MRWPEAQEEAGNRVFKHTAECGLLDVAAQGTHKHENFSKTKEDHEISRKDTDSHSRCIQTILLLYWQVLLLSECWSKSSTTKYDTDRVSSLAKAKQHRLPASTIVHLALGLLWPLGRALTTSATHYLTLSALASQTKGLKRWRLGHISSHRPAAQNWGFHTLRQNVRATVVYTKAHSLSKPYTTTLKTKAGNGRAALSMLPLGNRLRHAPSVTAHGNHLIHSCYWPKLTWGPHQQGPARGCTPLPALSCTDTASQEQGLGCTERQDTPTTARDHKHKNALHHNERATARSQCKTQVEWLGHFDHIFIL